MAKMRWKSNSEMFEEEKRSKKEVLSKECHDSIVNGFDYAINGIIHHFSYDMEAQTNLQETYQLFQNNVIEEIKWSAKLDGESVRLTFNKFNFEKLFYESVKHKQSMISKLKDEIEPALSTVSTKEELDVISWEPDNSAKPNFKINNTMDKELGSLVMKTEMSDRAIMEIANMVMGV